MDKPQFNLEHIERIYQLAQDNDLYYFKKVMEYEGYIKEQGSKLQFTEEQFNEVFEAQGYALVGSGLHEEALKNVKSKGYIITVKEEEPLIVHNVMSYKGKNYLKYPQRNRGEDGCKVDCDLFKELKCVQVFCIDKGLVWKSFDDIQITDELACMRKDIGDIYIRNRVDKQIFRFTHIVQGNKNELYNGCIEYKGGMLMPIAFDLATAEELQEYFKGIKK